MVATSGRKRVTVDNLLSSKDNDGEFQLGSAPESKHITPAKGAIGLSSTPPPTDEATLVMSSKPLQISRAGSSSNHKGIQIISNSYTTGAERSFTRRDVSEAADITTSPERSILRLSGDADLLGKRDLQEGSSLNYGGEQAKKRVIIDFEKAQRNAELAGLAPGFIIETEYPTQQRKVVQHIPAPGQRTVKLHLEGEELIVDDLLEVIGYDPASSASITSITTQVLDTHDRARMAHFANNHGRPDARLLSFPSYPHRDLV
ncbi:hypothetical protein CBS101457_001567 [Exobasidium rhododendri]|nr:hypothetical protein CBS101457_001567 [Exobasidium rhododendri]